jgi:hypothetical protein
MLTNHAGTRCRNVTFFHGPLLDIPAGVSVTIYCQQHVLTTSTANGAPPTVGNGAHLSLDSCDLIPFASVADAAKFRSTGVSGFLSLFRAASANIAVSGSTVLFPSEVSLCIVQFAAAWSQSPLPPVPSR